MKTVIQVVQHMRPGGIETMALDLATFCKKHEQTFIVSLEGDHQTAISEWPRLKPYAKQLIFLNKKHGWQPLLIFKLIRLIKKLNVNVVHTHHIGPLIYAGIAARAANVNCLIHTEHDAWHLNDARRCSLQRKIIRLTHPVLVADAETVAEAIQAKLHQQNIHIVHNGIDTERFIPGDQYHARKQLGLPQDTPLVGCSGRMEHVKGQSLLLDALTKMPNNTHLAFAGSGSIESELRDKSILLGLHKRVHFLGRVDDMPSFYQALDVFCLPSLNEGFPLSPLEAQACSIVTVVTHVGGSHETLCPYSGKLIPSGDVQTMANTLTDILNNPSLDIHVTPRHFVKLQGDVRSMARAYSKLHTEEA